MEAPNGMSRSLNSLLGGYIGDFLRRVWGGLGGFDRSRVQGLGA